MIDGRAAEPSLTIEELAAELALELPERDALTIVDPAVFSVLPIVAPSAPSTPAE